MIVVCIDGAKRMGDRDRTDLLFKLHERGFECLYNSYFLNPADLKFGGLLTKSNLLAHWFSALVEFKESNPSVTTLFVEGSPFSFLASSNELAPLAHALINEFASKNNIQIYCLCVGVEFGK